MVAAAVAGDVWVALARVSLLLASSLVAGLQPELSLLVVLVSCPTFLFALPARSFP